MKLKKDNSEQKLRGSYYTPKKLADFIVKWALADDHHRTNVLEPSCGDGVFLQSLAEYTSQDVNCLGVELDEEEAKKSVASIEHRTNFSVLNNDFFSVYESSLKNKQFDIIVGNPPYIRYQYLTNEQREAQSKILVANGMKSNKLINAWVSFVVACVQMLSKKGKIGLVIPAELLQVAYAEDLRLFLVNNLSKITVVTFRELVFKEVQQEVVILLGENLSECQEVAENRISVLEFADLESLDSDFGKLPVEYKSVDHTSDKWTKYFLTNEEINLVNDIKATPHFRTFGEIAQVDIGITTGDNKYFSVKQETVDKFDLHDVVIPLIGRSAQASGIFFTHDDWRKNVEKGVGAQLLNFPDIPFEEYPKGSKDYILYGEQTEVNKGYKCSIRNRWYRVPSIWAPDAFFLRRNNTFPKFVLNAINAVSTDTMHRIKFKEGVDPKKVLLSYYNSISFAFTELEGRSYGGGVLEILPGEVEKVVLPDLGDLDDSVTEYLIQKLDITIRNNGDINPILDEIDRKILIEKLGLEESVVSRFRVIWNKLMKRRHSRKSK
ncbi:Modification methylase Eco57IB [bioreactor metagenome]|uniref:Modification methylase Eco57IB n=1 Tax=bioreactor metagenome TaxID=1076179 RepID=A0A644TSQ7_9ZZZZ